jgi:predicted transcriptional regulator
MQMVKLKQNKFDCSTLSDDEMKIINCLKSGCTTVYEINAATKMNTGLILSLLTMLEMKGVVLKTGSTNYRIVI